MGLGWKTFSSGVSETTTGISRSTDWNVCVKKNSQRMFGGVMNTSYYYIEIVNDIPNTIALNWFY